MNMYIFLDFMLNTSLGTIIVKRICIANVKARVVDVDT